MAKKEKLFIITKKEPVTEMFTAEDMISFAARFSDFPEDIKMDSLREYIKDRNRERAIKEFIEEYDRKHG